MRVAVFIGMALLAACGRNEPNDAAEQGAANAAAPTEAPPPDTAGIKVQLASINGSNVSGNLTFTAAGKGVHIAGTINGLEPNSVHGFHIHETGDCSAPDGSSAGGHFSPMGHQHGAPGPDSHVGDLGNITADGEGTVHVDLQARQATLHSEQPSDIVGKAIILHAGADDLQSQPSGNSGDRIACGVIA